MFDKASSIGSKLNGIVAITTLLALIMAATALLLVDFQRGLSQARDDAQTLSNILALASAPALSFTDAKVATENLSMLEGKPNAVRAALYDAQGRLFASFPADRTASPAVPLKPSEDGVSVSSNFVATWHPVISNGERVGTIWLLVRHERLSQALTYLGIVIFIMAASLAAALLLSRRLQRAISGPILEVSAVAHSIVGGKTEGVRAVQRTNDEVGKLVQAFNAMLDELDTRARSLQQANEALRQSESRYQLAVRGSSAGLWDWDIASGTLFISPRFRAVLGYSSAQLPDAPEAVLSLLDAQERTNLRAALIAHLRDQQPFQLECRLIDASGLGRWFFVAGAALWNEQGRAYRMAGSVVEITERKEAERVLSEANRAKDEFLATLAHELRNPLAPIRTGLEILRRDKAHGPMSDKARATMERQLAHMVRLVDDLLDISRINSGKVQVTLERVDLLKVVETAVELSRPAIDAGQHQLIIEVPTAPVHLMADATRLAQAIGNLLNNAARYTNPGGQIVLRVQSHTSMVDVEVQDNGLGIATSMLEAIFQLFTQVKSPGSSAQGGLGIGLYLVRSLVELHGGTVVARSEGAALGSTFTIQLPLLPLDQSDSPLLTIPTSDRPLRGLKVLIVDDNVDAAQTMAGVLEFEGCATSVLHEGGGVLDHALVFQPDVILLDIGLPDISGYEVARMLRSDPRFKRTELIAVTGWGAEADRKEAKAAGFGHHLTKPVDIAALELLLRQVPRR